MNASLFLLPLLVLSVRSAAAPGPGDAAYDAADKACAQSRMSDCVRLLGQARREYRAAGRLRLWADVGVDEASMRMNAGDDDGARSVLAEVAAAARGRADLRASAARATLMRARLERLEKDSAKSEASLREGISALSEAAPRDPALIDAQLSLAEALKDRDAFAEAETAFDRAAKLASEERSGSRLADVSAHQAMNLDLLGRYDESLALLRKARAAVGADPAYDAFLSYAESRVLTDAGKLAEALATAKAAAEALRAANGDDSPGYAAARFQACEIAFKLKSFQDLASCSTDAIARLEKRGSAADVAHAHAALAFAAQATGSLDTAARELDRAERAARLSPSRLPLAEVDYERGLLDAEKGRAVEARRELAAALETRRRVLGEGHPKTAEAAAALRSLPGR